MKTIINISVVALMALLMTRVASAVCPVCTVAIGVGLGVSRWLGISDIIVATWIGALLASSAFWIFNFATKKGLKLKGLREMIFALFYAMALATLWSLNILGSPGNVLWGIDKFVFGVIIGTIVFIGSKISYDEAKKKRGKALFPFQKVVMPIVILSGVSIFLYFMGL